MLIINLPISKSIANRLLVRSALRGDLLSLPTNNLPEDVRVLYNALAHPSDQVNIGNCGTAMRFLTAYLAQKEGTTTLLDGNDRMRQRPIGVLVDALRLMGADIAYLQQEGYPPLRISGRRLHGTTIHIPKAESTQFISALLLISDCLDGTLTIQTDIRSPYITMTQRVLQGNITMEYDWSSAAFWYEYISLHPQATILLQGLSLHTIQGDAIVAQHFESLGVTTTETPQGILLSHNHTPLPHSLTIDFTSCPDLYPALYVTTLRLGIPLHSIGTERLQYKESDRLQAFTSLHADTRFYPSQHDHRVAMALLAADILTDDLACIDKSYPLFYSQLCELKSSYHAEE